jgi:hypothetical protein
VYNDSCKPKQSNWQSIASLLPTSLDAAVDKVVMHLLRSPPVSVYVFQAPFFFFLCHTCVVQAHDDLKALLEGSGKIKVEYKVWGHLTSCAS